MSTSPMTGQSFTRRWVLVSTLGWLLGFALVVVLAVAIEAFAGGVQVVVGVGMGAGVGFAQGWFLRRWLGSPWPWTWASTIGMGLPFLLQDAAVLSGRSLPSSLWIYVPVGGVLMAVSQRRLLRRVAGPEARWVLPCVIGWCLPVILIGVGDSIASLGLLGGILSLTAMFLGGLPLGLATARTLRVQLLEPAD